MWRPSLRVAVFLAMLVLAVSFFLQLLNLSSSGNASQFPEVARQAAEPSTRQLIQLPEWVQAQRSNSMASLTDSQLKTLAELSNQEQFLKLLQPILIPRVAGTPGNLKVQQHIIETLNGFGYTIERDSFEDNPPAPHSRRTFTNIIATLDPSAPRQLVLACHFDSKFDTRGEFIGATDSAVPCAMLLDLAANLRGRANFRQTKQDMTLQLLFLDGEEAFGEWSAKDSVYGSRHLANQLGKKRNKFAPEVATLTQLNSMDLFVLLDLIGTTDTQFENFFPDTAVYYKKIAATEDRLTNLGLIKTWGRKKLYFGRSVLPAGSFVDDDHRPFMEKGVRILHMISYPFPTVWHQYSDNFANIHYQTVDDLNKILRVFVCEYLSCRV